MSTNSIRARFTPNLFHNLRIQRGMAFGLIILTALFAFELFNYSTTDYALTDLLGELEFAGLRWATILAIAFCSIDFAGIARLFTPEKGTRAPNEVWYLFGAWLLAATMNAMLTWWGISLAILNHQEPGGAVIERETILRAAPIFVAILVWLIRVLIIGTFSTAGDRLFSMDERQVQPATRSYQQRAGTTTPNGVTLQSGTGKPQPSTAGPLPAQSLSTQPPVARQGSPSSAGFHPAPKPAIQAAPNLTGHSNTPPEPTYQSFSIGGERHRHSSSQPSMGRPGATPQ